MFRQSKRRLRWLFEYALVWPVVKTLQVLPESIAFAIGRWLGLLDYVFSVRDRRWCHRNLQLVYGSHLTPSDRSRLARAVYAHHATTVVEILRMDEGWIRERCSVEGIAHYREWRERNPKRGVIVISGHIGNFEILGRCVKDIGLSGTMVSRRLENPYLEECLQACRRRYGLETVPRGSVSLRDSLRKLRAGEAIGIAIDQNTAVRGVFVEFLGIPAATARGAAALALSEDTGVFVVHTYRLPDGGHRIVISPPIEVDRTGDFEKDVHCNTQRFSREYEQRILEHPEQYHWQHPRWRTRPDGSTWKSTDPIDAMMAARVSPPCRPPARYRSIPAIGSPIATS